MKNLIRRLLGICASYTVFRQKKVIIMPKKGQKRIINTVKENRLRFLINIDCEKYDIILNKPISPVA